jgi:hypothetical protein
MAFGTFFALYEDSIAVYEEVICSIQPHIV